MSLAWHKEILFLLLEVEPVCLWRVVTAVVSRYKIVCTVWPVCWMAGCMYHITYYTVLSIAVYSKEDQDPLLNTNIELLWNGALPTINSAASIDSKLAAGCMDPSSKQWKTQHVQIRFTQRGPKLPEVTIRERIQRGCSRLPTRWYIARWRSIRIIKCASSLWLAGLRIWFY